MPVSTSEAIVALLEDMPEEDRQVVYSVAHALHAKLKPNRDTLDALGEYFDMKNNPDQYPRYATFREAMNEVLSDA
jgi:hypothetical protein